jgi:mono/diheme cytochrome c family protein
MWRANHGPAGPGRGCPESPCSAALGRRLAASALGLALSPSLVDGALAGDIFSGQEVYARHCEKCHGADGRPLLPNVPNFTRGEGLQMTDTQMVRVLKAGKNLMPAFDKIIKEKDLLDVVAYTRTLDR